MGMLMSSLLLLALSLGWGWPALLIWYLGFFLTDEFSKPCWELVIPYLAANIENLHVGLPSVQAWMLILPHLMPCRVEHQKLSSSLGWIIVSPPHTPTEDGMDPNLLSNGFDEDLVVLSLYDAGLLNRNKEEFWPEIYKDGGSRSQPFDDVHTGLVEEITVKQNVLPQRRRERKWKTKGLRRWLTSRSCTPPGAEFHSLVCFSSLLSRSMKII